MTKARSTTPEHWVKMRIPDRFKMGWKGIAERCGWAIRKTGEPETYLVTLRENYEQKLSASLRPQKILDAAQAGDTPRYEAFRWSGQDQFMDADMRNLVMGQAQRLIDRGERVPLWAAFSLLNLATADADLPTHLRAFYPVFASQLPDSSSGRSHSTLPSTRDAPSLAGCWLLSTHLSCSLARMTSSRDSKLAGDYQAPTQLDSAPS